MRRREFLMAAAMPAPDRGDASPSAVEALTFEQSLRINTEWAACSVFEDHEKATITPGKLADFAVLPSGPGTLDGADLRHMGVDATSVAFMLNSRSRCPQLWAASLKLC